MFITYFVIVESQKYLQTEETNKKQQKQINAKSIEIWLLFSHDTCKIGKAG